MPRPNEGMMNASSSDSSANGDGDDRKKSASNGNTLKNKRPVIGNGTGAGIASKKQLSSVKLSHTVAEFAISLKRVENDSY